MILLQTPNSFAVHAVLFIGTVCITMILVSLIGLVIFQHRREIKYQRKMQALKEEQQKMRLLASINSQEEERQRMAADLHDDAGPLLAATRLYLSENIVNMDRESQLESILLARELIDETIQVVRNISHDLMPPTLKNFGLESAISSTLQKINSSNTIKTECNFDNYEERLEPDRELNIFRVLQELINNILKHSKANFIYLYQNIQENKMVIRMLHDGRGITQPEFERLNKNASGLGLKNIASRIHVANGSIIFDKNPESNYQITIEVPIKDNSNSMLT